MFALFKNGNPITKPHSTWWPCVVEAHERGLITRASGHNLTMAPFCEIKELDEPSEVAVRRERDEDWR